MGTGVINVLDPRSLKLFHKLIVMLSRCFIILFVRLVFSSFRTIPGSMIGSFHGGVVLISSFFR